MHEIVYYAEKVYGLVEAHATKNPLGGIFTPEKIAIAPHYLFDAPAPDLTNVYFTLAPNERDGRVLWKYIDRASSLVQDDLRSLRFPQGVGLRRMSDELLLRRASWSVGSPSILPFFVLGLTPDRRGMIGTDAAVVQMKSSISEEILSAFTSSHSEYQLTHVSRRVVFDDTLREGGSAILFGHLSEFDALLKTIGNSAVINNISDYITREQRLFALDEAVGGRDIASIPASEREAMLRRFFGIE